MKLGCFSSEGVTRNHQIKYTVNPEHAKSVFRLDCANQECVAGDFDLIEALAQAVAARRATVSGEMCCEGWLNKATIDSFIATASCAINSVLRMENVRQRELPNCKPLEADALAAFSFRFLRSGAWTTIGRNAGMKP